MMDFEPSPSQVGDHVSESDPRTTRQTAPLYKQSYADASVLVCRIVDMEKLLAPASASDQLLWLHNLHTKVDTILRHIHAIKVDITGDILHFVSGTENGDQGHAVSLLMLVRELTKLSATLRLPGGQPLLFQMGMHTGQVVTGVVGNRALKYGVFGSTVSIARQLESLSSPTFLCASVDTIMRLPEREEGWVQGHIVKLPDWRELETFRLALAPVDEPRTPAHHSTGASCAGEPTALSAKAKGAKGSIARAVLAMVAIVGPICWAYEGNLARMAADRLGMGNSRGTMALMIVFATAVLISVAAVAAARRVFRTWKPVIMRSLTLWTGM